MWKRIILVILCCLCINSYALDKLFRSRTSSDLQNLQNSRKIAEMRADECQYAFGGKTNIKFIPEFRYRKQILYGLLYWSPLRTGAYDQLVPPQITGVACHYFANGKPHGMLSFKNGQAEGIAKYYYESGKLRSESLYRNGKREGIAKSYFENGKLEAEFLYKDNKREGVAKTYYPSGELAAESPYENGVLEGWRKIYRENGNLFATIFYKNDQTCYKVGYYKGACPVSGVCHHSDGTTRSLTNAELKNLEEFTCD